MGANMNIGMELSVMSVPPEMVCLHALSFLSSFGDLLNSQQTVGDE